MSSPSQMVDWDLAGRTARRLVNPGPETTRDEAAAVVRELHEVTHQLQFTAFPWLKSHLEAQIAEFVEATDLSPDVLRERLTDLLRSLGDAVRGGDGDGGSEGLLALGRDPEQRAVLDRVTAVMSLVE